MLAKANANAILTTVESDLHRITPGRVTVVGLDLCHVENETVFFAHNLSHLADK